MTAKEWLEVMKQAVDYNHAMTPLIEKYGEMLLAEQHPTPSMGAEEIEKWYSDWLDRNEPGDWESNIKMLKAFASSHQPGWYSREDVIRAIYLYRELGLNIDKTLPDNVAELIEKVISSLSPTRQREQ